MSLFDKLVLFNLEKHYFPTLAHFPITHSDYVKTVPHVYYFSHNTDATRRSVFKPKDQVPGVEEFPVLWPISALMGAGTRL